MITLRLPCPPITTLDQLSSHLHQSRQQFQQDDGIHWVPIRHHSPACAYYLAQLLQQVQPEVVLIEGAVDFNLKLADRQTAPPVALYHTSPVESHAFLPTRRVICRDFIASPSYFCRSKRMAERPEQKAFWVLPPYGFTTESAHKNVADIAVEFVHG